MDRFLTVYAWVGLVMCLAFAGVAIHMGWDFERRVVLSVGIFFGLEVLFTSVAQRHEKRREKGAESC